MTWKTIIAIALIAGLGLVATEIYVTAQLACCAPTRATLGGG